MAGGWWYIGDSEVEEFPLLEIPRVHGLNIIPNSKPYLVVKINNVWVHTTKKGLKSGFGKVRFENQTSREVLQ
jgi:hypothetical protein